MKVIRRVESTEKRPRYEDNLLLVRRDTLRLQLQDSLIIDSTFTYEVLIELRLSKRDTMRILVESKLPKRDRIAFSNQKISDFYMA